MCIRDSPFIEDNERNIKAIVEKAKGAGASYIIFGLGVSLRDRQREYYYNKLDRYFPGITEKYKRTYGLKYWCNSPRYEELTKTAHELCAKYNMPVKMPFYIPGKEDSGQFELL
jgi:hypothetical protein